MDHSANRALQHFKSDVGIQFQLYNSLFKSLPFHRIEKTGILLSLLLSNSEDGYLKNQSPVDIIEEFFSKHTSYKSDKEKLDLLFRFVQYAERQVVLFDALEDAAFRQIHGDQCISAFFRGIHGVRRSDRRERGLRKVHKIWRIAAGRESRHRSKPGIHRAFRNLRHYFSARYFAISASKKSTSFQRCRTIFGRYRRISSLNFEDRKSIEKRASTSFK